MNSSLLLFILERDSHSETRNVRVVLYSASSIESIYIFYIVLLRNGLDSGMCLIFVNM